MRCCPSSLIDTTWESHIKPLLKAESEATEEELSAAQAYAYAVPSFRTWVTTARQRVLQRLTHYVRSGDFVLALLRDAQNVMTTRSPGALSHYATDNQGHRLRRIARYYSLPETQEQVRRFRDYEETRSPRETEFGFEFCKCKGNMRLRVTTTS